MHIPFLAGADVLPHGGIGWKGNIAAVVSGTDSPVRMRSKYRKSPAKESKISRREEESRKPSVEGQKGAICYKRIRNDR
jgi:hypothetical protein